MKPLRPVVAQHSFPRSYISGRCQGIGFQRYCRRILAPMLLWFTMLYFLVPMLFHVSPHKVGGVPTSTGRKTPSCSNIIIPIIVYFQLLFLCRLRGFDFLSFWKTRSFNFWSFFFSRAWFPYAVMKADNVV